MTTDDGRRWPMRKEISEDAMRSLARLCDIEVRQTTGVDSPVRDFECVARSWLASIPDVEPRENPPCVECEFYADEAGDGRCMHPGSIEGNGHYPWGIQKQNATADKQRGRWDKFRSPAPACFRPNQSARDRLAKKIVDAATKAVCDLLFGDPRKISADELATAVSDAVDSVLPAEIGDVDDR